MFLKKIRKFFQVNWLKSFMFNIHFLKLKDALKFPILVGYGMHVDYLGEKDGITIKGPLHFGSVILGLSGGAFEQGKRGTSYWKNKGHIIFGNNVHFSRSTSINVEEGAEFVVGDNFVGSANQIFNVASSVIIKDNVLIGWGTNILDTDGHNIYNGEGIIINQPKQIIIGNHVWIGSNVLVLKGSIIPDNCIVGAKSIITQKFVEESSIIAGAPAAVHKHNVMWSNIE